MRLIKQHFQSILDSYQSNRIMAIDLLRGITVFAMILVNNPGSWSHIYPPLEHAPWHGWTLTDLVFPFFLLIVGVSIAIAFSNKPSRLESYQSVAIRSFKLLVLGWILGLSYYNFYDTNFSWIEQRLYHIRWFGVLQRIALVYFICANLYLMIGSKHRKIIFAIIGLFCLVSYWLLMILIPYSDQQGNQYQGLLIAGNNLAAYIDHHLFGQAHLYHQSSRPFASDPEGLLTTLPALVSCILGILIGQQMVNQNLSMAQLKKLFLAAIALILIAYLLSPWIPFNKNLWTPSYVLLSAGLAIILLVGLMLLVDIKGYRLYLSPFLVFGTNAIALFMLSGFAVRLLLMIKYQGHSIKYWLYQLFQADFLDPKLSSLLFALVFILLMYIPLLSMYRRKIFWKV